MRQKLFGRKNMIDKGIQKMALFIVIVSSILGAVLYAASILTEK
jgi:hypothetical protein